MLNDWPNQELSQIVIVCDQFIPCKKYQVPNRTNAIEAKTKSVARKLEKVVVPVRIMWKKFTVKNIVNMTKITK